MVLWGLGGGGIGVPIGELEKVRREVAKARLLAGRTLGRAVGPTALRERAIDAIVRAGGSLLGKLLVRRRSVGGRVKGRFWWYDKT